MNRKKHITQVSEQDALDIINNSVQVAPNRLTKSAEENKKLFVQPIANLDEKPSVLKVVERLAKETEESLEEIDEVAHKNAEDIEALTRVVSNIDSGIDAVIENVEVNRQDIVSLQERVEIIDGSCEARYDQLLEQDSLMNEDITQLKEIVAGLPGAVVFNDYKSLLLAMKDNPSKDMFKLGQTIYIVTPDVPDLWVGEILDEDTGIDDSIGSLDTEVVDRAVIESINAINALEVGWYKFRPHETKTTIQGTNIENGSGTGSVQQVADGVADGFDFTGKNPNATALDTTLTGIIPYGACGNFASAFGGKSSAQGKRSNAEGTTTVAKGDYSHTEGNATVTLGANAHAEGAITVASGGSAHAEGQRTQALGEASHSEGIETKAMLKGSHAEGYGTVAGENYAHAEGYACEALHEESHAEGYYTKTGRPFQHVSGAYNEGNADTIFEVGNGNAKERKNAFEVKDDNSISIIFNGQKVSLQELLQQVADGGGGGTKLYQHEYINRSYKCKIITTIGDSLPLENFSEEPDVAILDCRIYDKIASSSNTYKWRRPLGTPTWDRGALYYSYLSSSTVTNATLDFSGYTESITEL